ncbi:MAG: SRPBCC family protein [Candidatus Ranarchaeia archaeon]
MPKEIIKKTRVTDLIEINAPIEVVWKDLTHFEEYDWDSDIQKVEILTPEIRGVGMKTRWKFENHLGEEHLQIEEIMEWNPPNYYTYKPHNAPSPRIITWILKPTEKGTLAIVTKLFENHEPNLEKIEKVTVKQMQKIKKSSEEKAKKSN